MRSYKNQHKYCRGFDLHAKMMYVCIIDQAGTFVVHKNIPADRQRFLALI